MANKIPSGRFLNDGEKRDLAHNRGVQVQTHRVMKPKLASEHIRDLGKRGSGEVKPLDLKAPSNTISPGMGIKQLDTIGAYRKELASMKAFYASERQYNFGLSEQQINQQENSALQALRTRFQSQGLYFNEQGEPVVKPVKMDAPSVDDYSQPASTEGFTLSPHRQAAVDFANKYAMDPSFNYDATPGGNTHGGDDCTNFASNVLRAGGFKEDGGWHLDDNTDHWQTTAFGSLSGAPTAAYDRADGLNHYLESGDGARENGPVGSVIGTLMGNPQTLQAEVGAGGSMAMDPLWPSHHGLQPGDLIQYNVRGPAAAEGSVEASQDGSALDHTGVFVGRAYVTDADGNQVLTDMIAQHSSSREHAPWYFSGSSHEDMFYKLWHIRYPGES